MASIKSQVSKKVDNMVDSWYDDDEIERMKQEEVMKQEAEAKKIMEAKAKEVLEAQAKKESMSLKKIMSDEKVKQQEVKHEVKQQEVKQDNCCYNCKCPLSYQRKPFTLCSKCYHTIKIVKCSLCPEEFSTSVMEISRCEFYGDVIRCNKCIKCKCQCKCINSCISEKLYNKQKANDRVQKPYRQMCGSCVKEGHQMESRTCYSCQSVHGSYIEKLDISLCKNCNFKEFKVTCNECHKNFELKSYFYFKNILEKLNPVCEPCRTCACKCKCSNKIITREQFNKQNIGSKRVYKKKCVKCIKECS